MEQQGLARAAQVGEEKFEGKHVIQESRVEKIILEGPGLESETHLLPRFGYNQYRIHSCDQLNLS